MSVGLWIGTESQNWNAAQFKQATAWCVAHGIDTLFIKAFDGANVWYNGARALNAMLGNVPLRIIPYGFVYGDTYQGLTAETENARSFASVFGTVCLDVEEPVWDVSIASGWAARFVGALSGYKLVVSCQANPIVKGQLPMLQAFSKFKDVVFAPQLYDDYLGTIWQDNYKEVGDVVLQPTYHLGQDVGKNDLLAQVAKAKVYSIQSISLWHYGLAVNNPKLVAQVLSTFDSPVAQRITWVSNGQQQQAIDTWAIGRKVVTALFPGTGQCDYTSGIGKFWQFSFMNGTNLGYPTTPEIATVNWNGDKIVVVWFSSGSRIEWDGIAKVYP
jgi:hypothetical protein